VALIAVRLLTPALRNAVGINLNVGLYGTGFWLFLGGLLVLVALLGGAYPSLVLARVPPIEVLRKNSFRVSWFSWRHARSRRLTAALRT